VTDHPWSGLSCFPLLEAEFISEDERQTALAFLAAHEADFGATDPENYWAGRTLTLPQVRDAATQALLRDLQRRIIRKVREVLTERLGPQPPLYADVINFARWPPGYELLPHADAENPGGEPHPYPWRHFASVIYLNDDYGGGAIHFPELGIDLRPPVRTLLVFPGTLDYLHGVRPVTHGMRHTLASFLTFDAAHDASRA
jgi:hypothetical protein